MRRLRRGRARKGLLSSLDGFAIQYSMTHPRGFNSGLVILCDIRVRQATSPPCPSTYLLLLPPLLTLVPLPMYYKGRAFIVYNYS